MQYVKDDEGNYVDAATGLYPKDAKGNNIVSKTPPTEKANKDANKDANLPSSASDKNKPKSDGNILGMNKFLVYGIGASVVIASAIGLYFAFSKKTTEQGK